MHLFPSREAWSFSFGFNRPIDFCLWVLEVDGLRAPPFDLHADGDGSLRAAGLDAPGWYAWLMRVAGLQQAQQQALQQRPSRSPTDWQSVLIPQAHQPALAWEGKAEVGARLAALWEQYGPIGNQRQAGEQTLTHRLNKADIKGPRTLYDALRPYRVHLPTLVVHLAAYPHPITCIFPPTTALLTVPPESQPDAAEMRERFIDVAATLAATTPAQRRSRQFVAAPWVEPHQPGLGPGYRVYASRPAPPAPEQHGALPVAQSAEERAILDWLVRHRDTYSGIRLATIRFSRQKSIPGWYLRYVAFEDGDGDPQRQTMILRQHADGSWTVSGASSSSDPRGMALLGLVPVRDHPQLFLSGSKGGDADGTFQFVAHGEVLANGFDVARVRLANDAGQVFEDVVEDGLVLFATIQREEVRWPMRAELYDRTGKLLWRETVLSDRPAGWPRFGAR